MRMTLLLTTIALALCGCGKEGDAQAAGPGGPLAAARGPLPANSVRVQRVEVMDPSGFEKPVVAMHVFIPVGWKTQGGIVWGNQGPCGSDYAIRWMATAPDGITSVAVLPGSGWSTMRTNMPMQLPPNPCEGNWRTARQYLEALAQRSYPGVRLLDYRSRPKAAQALQQMIDQIQPLQSELMRTRWTADAGDLLIAHTVNGREVREMIGTTVMINETQYADIINPGQVGMEQLMGFPTMVTFSRAPVGQLDFTLASAIANTSRQTEDWTRRIAEYERRKQEARRPRPSPGQPAGDGGHAARMEAIKAMGDASTGAYNDRDLTTDRMRRENIEAIRGVETYSDPVAGTPVQFDYNYNHAWRVNDGSYLLTKDPNFNPNAYGLEAQQLQVIP